MLLSSSTKWMWTGHGWWLSSQVHDGTLAQILASSDSSSDSVCTRRSSCVRVLRETYKQIAFEWQMTSWNVTVFRVLIGLTADTCSHVGPWKLLATWNWAPDPVIVGTGMCRQVQVPCMAAFPLLPVFISWTTHSR